MSSVFHRGLRQDLPVAVRADGCWIFDSEARPYLDAAGGAVVVNVGHGDSEVLRAMADQAARVDYVHGTQFTTRPLETYAQELAAVLPVDGARVYPVSGGSEAMETALKMARAYHLARGEPGRHKVVARWGSYHGNSRGALDASGREPLRRPYEPWLGHALHVPPVYEYRCPSPTHPAGCGTWHAEQLDRLIRQEGPDTVACFVAEPIGGATLGAAVPPDDYWPAVADVCRTHGVLLVADEVMTGFGRTGRWFGCDHWAVRPDLLVAGKGASSGYWPLGLAVCSGGVFEAIGGAGAFVHGFTYSHSAVGAAVGLAVLRRLREDDLVPASAEKGERLRKGLRETLAGHPNVGEVRGRGLLVGIELVADRETKRPFPRARQAAESVVGAARHEGLLLYFSTGSAAGAEGDFLLLGPPFTIGDPELAQAVERTTAALERALPPDA